MSEGFWVLLGVVVTGMISIVTVVVSERYAAARQKRQLGEERKQRREELWIEHMTGPFLDLRRELVEDLIAILSESPTSQSSINEARKQQRLVPDGIRGELGEWIEAWDKWEPGENGQSFSAEVEACRYSARHACVDHLHEMVSGKVVVAFAERLEVPSTQWADPSCDPFGDE